MQDLIKIEKQKNSEIIVLLIEKTITSLCKTGSKVSEKELSVKYLTETKKLNFNSVLHSLKEIVKKKKNDTIDFKTHKFLRSNRITGTKDKKAWSTDLSIEAKKLKSFIPLIISECKTNEEILSYALEHNIISDEVFSFLSAESNRDSILKLGCFVYDLKGFENEL